VDRQPTSSGCGRSIQALVEPISDPPALPAPLDSRDIGTSCRHVYDLNLHRLPVVLEGERQRTMDAFSRSQAGQLIEMVPAVLAASPEQHDQIAGAASSATGFSPARTAREAI
jgi:hypothetical protein